MKKKLIIFGQNLGIPAIVNNRKKGREKLDTLCASGVLLQEG